MSTDPHDTPNNAPAGGAGSGVEQIVRELRDELATISAHELEVARQEQALLTERRRIEQAAQRAADEQIERAKQTLQRRAEALAEQGAGLTAQRQQLDRLAKELQGEHSKLELLQETLLREAALLERRRNDLAHRLWERRHRLRHRLEVVHQREHELGTRVRRARDDLATQRATLEQQRQSLLRRQAELEARQLDTRAAAERAAAATAEAQAARLATRLRERRQVLRNRIMVVRAREVELTRRVQMARDEIVRQRNAAQQVQVEARQRAAQLSERERALEQRRQELAAQQQDFAARRAAADAALAQVAQEKENYEQQRQRLQQIAAAVETRQARLALEQTRLDSQAHRTRDEEQVLTQQREALVAELAELQARRDEFAQQRSSLEQQSADLGRRQRTLEAQRRQIQEEAGRFANQRESLGAQARALENERRQAKVQERALAERLAGLERRQQTLEAEESAYQQRLHQLDARQVELERAGQTVASEKERIARLRARLAERERATEESRRTAQEQHEQARTYHQQALALRDEMEERDSASRQAALAAEVERDVLERERAQLEAAQHQLDALRDERTAQFEAARTRLEQQARQLHSWQARIVGPGRWWWLRTLVLSAAGACAAATAWLAFNPPRFQVAADLMVTSAALAGTPASAPADETAIAWRRRVLAEHVRQLTNPELLAAQGDPNVSAAWRALCTRGAVDAQPDGEADAIHVRLTSPDSAATGLLEAALRTYRERVNTVVGAALPPEYTDLAAWRETLAGRCATLEQQQVGRKAELATLPTNAEREAAVTAADARQRELVLLGDRLATQRAALADLQQARAVAGAVTAADVETALQQDAIYQEDNAEFEQAGAKYRTELLVGFMLLVEPLKEAREALTTLTQAIAEQRGLEPPAELLGLLEGCTTDADRMQGRLTEFTEQLRGWTVEVQKLEVTAANVATGVTLLVQRQRDLAAAAEQLAREATALLAQNQQRVTKLADEGARSTRAVVVATMLRSEHTALERVMASLNTALNRTALSANVELDAQDRRLRGLQMRLQEREGFVLQQLQVAADQAARAAHQERVAALQAEVDTLTLQRDGLVADLQAALAKLRELDAAAARRTALEAQVAGDVEMLTDWRRQLAAVDAQLAEVRRQGAEPDRVTAGPVTTLRLDAQRMPTALGLGAGAAASVWIIALALLLRWPAPKRMAELEALQA